MCLKSVAMSVFFEGGGERGGAAHARSTGHLPALFCSGVNALVAVLSSSSQRPLRRLVLSEGCVAPPSALARLQAAAAARPGFVLSVLWQAQPAQVHMQAAPGDGHPSSKQQQQQPGSLGGGGGLAAGALRVLSGRGVR
jgi:hypothetical protein